MNYLSSDRGNAWKLSYFHFFSLLLRFSYEIKCCESFFSLLLRFSYKSIILISKKDIARMVKASIVRTIKLQAALPKRTLVQNFFLVIFRVSVLSKCFEKSITVWLYQTRLHHSGFWENVICFDFFFRDNKSINLIKSHEGPKGRVVFARRCFTIKLIWKNIHSKETVMKSFFQLGHNLQLYWKRTPSQLFSDDFRKTFHITVVCQNAS